MYIYIYTYVYNVYMYVYMYIVFNVSCIYITLCLLMYANVYFYTISTLILFSDFISCVP